MKILLTGASSFTGLWFAESLAAKGLHVVAPLRRGIKEYDGLRFIRVQRLRNVAEIVENCNFGDEKFLDLVRGDFDVLCAHAAQVGDYRNPDFDVQGALQSNTHNLAEILREGKKLRGIFLTGSIFEAGEGGGKQEAFTPYGLSKTLTSAAFFKACQEAKLPFTHFIIANPFGPYEEPRFCNYLMRCWTKKEKALVKTPDYLRDNVPVSLLAKSYADGVEKMLEGRTIAHLAPSGYAEKQGAFAKRVGQEIGQRLNLTCEVEFARENDYNEPMSRLNPDKPDVASLGWNENEAWDELAAYYRATMF